MKQKKKDSVNEQQDRAPWRPFTSGNGLLSPTVVGCVTAPCPQGAHPQVAGLSLISISCKFLLFSVRVRAPKLERTNSPKRILGFIHTVAYAGSLS